MKYVDTYTRSADPNSQMGWSLLIYSLVLAPSHIGFSEILFNKYVIDDGGRREKR